MPTEPKAVSSPSEVELLFALVAPIGTDLDRVTQITSDFLSSVEFQCESIRLSDSFNLTPEERSKTDGKKLISRLMDCGDALRKSTKNNAAVAAIAIGEVSKLRSKNCDSKRPTSAIIRQLKTPEEIDLLRKIYGSRLVVISCHSSHSNRVKNLSRRLAEHRHEIQMSNYRSDAESLINRDESDSRYDWGQNVRKTFPMADLFVDVDNHSALESSLVRVLQILFGHPYHTPTKDEYGMFLAEGAALRSAALGRQVGAVVTTQSGDIISVGSNEVPKAGGGMYWEGDTPDLRDCTLGFDTNDRFKEKLLGEIISRLVQAKWIKQKKASKEIKTLVHKLIYNKKGAILSGSQVTNIIEFGRCVHAEMAAIVDAARRGTSVNDSVLYTTTFPCHECARHIVAAGIKRVVYRLPYAKSLVRELYPDSIDIDGDGADNDRVLFEPFVGVAPRRYTQFFKMRDRKDDKGNTIPWKAIHAKPNLGDYFPDHDLIKRDEEFFILEFQGENGRLGK